MPYFLRKQHIMRNFISKYKFMKYDQIPNSLFIKNRKKFMDRMQPKSIAVFNSNDIYPMPLIKNIAKFCLFVKPMSILPFGKVKN